MIGLMVEELKSNIRKLNYFMYTLITMNILGGLTCQKKVANCYSRTLIIRRRRKLSFLAPDISLLSLPATQAAIPQLLLQCLAFWLLDKLCIL